MSFKNGLVRIVFLSLILCLVGTILYSVPERYDLLIKATNIVDGTGKASFKGDIAIKGEKIVAVGRVRGDAAIVIDGSGLVTCPGFIDTHSHGDQSIVRYPLAENFVMQGVTTVLAGNCGNSPAPLKDLTFSGWLSKVEESGISINLAMLVGHGTIRNFIMGEDFKREATKEEIEKMKSYVDEAMRSGAFGLSSFLDPSVAEYASIGELIELAKVAQKYGGLYSPHTRNHQNQWWSDDLQEFGYGIIHSPQGYGISQFPRGEIIAGRYHGLLEAIEISKKANNIPLLIAHFTPAYTIPEPHPEFLQEAVAKATLMEIIDKAREKGQKVYFNAIACSSSIGAQEPIIASFFSPRLHLPEWLKSMKKNEFVEKLKTREFREKVKGVINSGRFKFGMLHPLQDPYWMDCYRILICKNKSYEGKNLGEIARERSHDSIIKAVYNDSYEALFDILVEDPDATWALILDKREYPGALPVFFKHPAGMPCIDCVSLPASSPKREQSLISGESPIYFGLFPHYINLFVKEKRVLSLEEAIKKATSVAAQEVLCLKDRGIINPGFYADLVVFDFGKISMAGDFLNPALPPGGIEYVFVNGKIVYKEKAHTAEKHGKVLRHSQ